MLVRCDCAVSYRSSATDHSGAANTRQRVRKPKGECVITIRSTAATFDCIGVVKMDIERAGAAMHFLRDDIDQSHWRDRLVAQNRDGRFKQMRRHDLRFAVAVEIAGSDKGWIVIGGPAEWSSHIICVEYGRNKRA